MLKPLLATACSVALPVLLSACDTESAEGPRHRVDPGSGVALVYREPREGLVTMNASAAGGIFQLRGNCLVVEVEGDVRTPVFPVPARYDPGALAVLMGGRSYALGRQWQLEFASAGDGPIKHLANAAAMPESCPKAYFYFGGITEQVEAGRTR